MSDVSRILSVLPTAGVRAGSTGAAKERLHQLSEVARMDEEIETKNVETMLRTTRLSDAPPPLNRSTFVRMTTAFDRSHGVADGADGAPTTPAMLRDDPQGILATTHSPGSKPTPASVPASGSGSATLRAASPSQPSRRVAAVLQRSLCWETDEDGAWLYPESDAALSWLDTFDDMETCVSSGDVELR